VNSDWWRWKLERNQSRDADTNNILAEAGWLVARYWEHEAVSDVVRDVIQKLRERA
jgi:DNA mismatch endonuclease (patch repair protein)